MRPLRNTVQITLLTTALLVVAFCVAERDAHAQVIYVSNADPIVDGQVSEYSISGQPIVPDLVPFNSNATGGSIAESGGDLFLAGSKTISAYTTAGALAKSALITGFDGALSIDSSGGNLFVSDAGAGTVGEYTAAGAPINPDLISVVGASGIAVAEGNIYVSSFDGFVGKYTTAGVPINPMLLTLPNGASAISLTAAGGNLYVGGSGIVTGGTVAEYTLAGGQSTRR